jgi:hypothetical protein
LRSRDKDTAILKKPLGQERTEDANTMLLATGAQQRQARAG